MPLHVRMAELNGEDPQRGTALVEAAILLPVLFLLVACLIDFGRMIQAHAVLSQAANEAVRLGSKVRNLEEGSFEGGLEERPQNHHELIHGRLQLLFKLEREQLPLEDVVFESTCSNSTDSVQVEIQGSYFSIFPLIQRIPIWAAQRTKYLGGTPCSG